MKRILLMTVMIICIPVGYAYAEVETMADAVKEAFPVPTEQSYIDKSVYLCFQDLIKGKNIKSFKMTPEVSLDLVECLQQYGVDANLNLITGLPNKKYFKDLSDQELKKIMSLKFFKLNDNGRQMLANKIKTGSYHEFLVPLGSDPAAKVIDIQPQTPVKGKPKDATQNKDTHKHKKPVYVVPDQKDDDGYIPKPVFIR